MKLFKIDFFFFYGVVMSLLAGAYKYGFIMFLIFVLIFSVLLYLTYLVYSVFYKIGGKLYDGLFRDKIEGYKKAKKSIQNEE